MWQFLAGFGFGVYMGTYYDCKPYLDEMNKWFKQHIPPKK